MKIMEGREKQNVWILNDYISEYIDKVFLYGSKVWSCEYSDHTGLTFKEAMESEKTALKQLKDFPECLKEPLLKTIHQGKLKDITNFLEYWDES